MLTLNDMKEQFADAFGKGVDDFVSNVFANAVSHRLAVVGSTDLAIEGGSYIVGVSSDLGILWLQL